MPLRNAVGVKRRIHQYERARQPGTTYSCPRYMARIEASATWAAVRVAFSVSLATISLFVLLYDLAADPGEKENLASRRPAEVERLRALLVQRFGGIPRRGGKQEVPAGLKEELKALGYVAH